MLVIERQNLLSQKKQKFALVNTASGGDVGHRLGCVDRMSFELSRDCTVRELLPPIHHVQPIPRGIEVTLSASTSLRTVFSLITQGCLLLVSEWHAENPIRLGQHHFSICDMKSQVSSNSCGIGNLLGSFQLLLQIVAVSDRKKEALEFRAGHDCSRASWRDVVSDA